MTLFSLSFLILTLYPVMSEVRSFQLKNVSSSWRQSLHLRLKESFETFLMAISYGGCSFESVVNSVRQGFVSVMPKLVCTDTI